MIAYKSYSKRIEKLIAETEIKQESKRDEVRGTLWFLSFLIIYIHIYRWWRCNNHYRVCKQVSRPKRGKAGCIGLPNHHIKLYLFVNDFTRRVLNHTSCTLPKLSEEDVHRFSSPRRCSNTMRQDTLSRISLPSEQHADW